MKYRVFFNDFFVSADDLTAWLNKQYAMGFKFIAVDGAYYIFEDLTETSHER